MVNDNKCSYTLVFKVIFISFLLSKLSILVFLQYPSPVADSSFFLSVSKFHCTDGIFRTPIFPMEEIGALYLWHSIMQPLIISLLSYNCSVQSFYIGLSFLIISTIFLIFILKIKSREDKFFWIFSMIVFALQAKQGFRHEVISIFIIILIEYFFLKKKYIFVLPLVFLAWSQPTVFLIETIFIILRLNNNYIKIFLKKIYKIILIITITNIVIGYLYPFNIYDHINFLIKNAQYVNTKIPSDIFTYYIRSDFFPLFGFAFIILFGFLIYLKKRFLLLCFPIYYFGLRFPETYYNLVPLYISLIYYINNILWGELDRKTKPLLNIFRYYLLIVFFVATVGLSQGIARDLFSKINYNASPESIQKIYKDLILRNKEVCEVPDFFTLFLNFNAFEKNFRPTKKCNNQKQDIINIYPVNGYDKAKLIGKNCKISHTKKTGSLLNNIFKSDSGYAVYICPKN